MRKISIFIALSFIFLLPSVDLAAEQAPGYALHDSKIDPNDFENWTMIEESERCGGQYCSIVIQKDDLYVLCMIDYTWRNDKGQAVLIKYVYYEHGQLAQFVLQKGFENSVYYKRIEFSEGEEPYAASRLAPYMGRSTYLWLKFREPCTVEPEP